MTDERTRALEREGVVTPAWVRARMRSGKLPRRRVLCAAYLGCPAAREVLGWPAPQGWHWPSAPIRDLDHMAREGQERGADVDLLDAFVATHLSSRARPDPDRAWWVTTRVRQTADSAVYRRFRPFLHPHYRPAPPDFDLDLAIESRRLAEKAKHAKALAHLLLTWED